MKMNVPVEEANEQVKWIGANRMGYLFENFEKVDIQAERRNTAKARAETEEAKAEAEEAKAEAEEAKAEAEEAKAEAEEAKAKAEEAKAEAESAKAEAEEARQKLQETGYINYLSACKECEISKEEAISKFGRKFNLSEDEAMKKVEQYW